MIKNKDSLKAKASNLAKKTDIPNKYIIQNFMFETLLKRIVKSQYKDKFIIKGGLLLSSIFGVNLRSTMDLDTTIKGFSLDIDTITKVINEIIAIDIGDNIILKIENIKPIREEETYGGFNVNLKADFDGLRTNLMIDITTGDIITYKEVEYSYKTLFDEEIINIMTYNLETMIAEKFETIISRNINNSRIYNMHSVHKILEEFDISDIMLNNIHIDVRVVFDENYIFVPKSHFEYDILPDVYFVLLLAEDHSHASFLGFFGTYVNISIFSWVFIQATALS